MPNHVQHNIEFEGPADQVTALLNYIKGEEEGNLFDFNTVIPMPDALKGTTSPCPADDELVKLYGHSDWYGWACDVWGTKWGAYDTALTEDGLRFQTAWSTAPKVFVKLSELFPEVQMRIDFADEDIGSNVGQFTYKGGELLVELIGDMEDACRIWGYDYEEYKAEQEEWAAKDAVE